MKTSKSKIVAMIPASPTYNKWSSFYADSFHPVWTDGKVGNHMTRHTPTPDLLDEIRTNIPLAIKKCEKYIEELKRAEKLLSTPKQRKAQSRMAKLIQEHEVNNT